MIGLYVARHKRRRHEIKNTSGILPIIQLSRDGHVDIKNRKLVQVNNPESDNDVVNLATLKTLCMTGDPAWNATNWNANNLRITNLYEAEHASDAVNLKGLNERLS